MKRNIELKARCPDLGDADRTARRLGATLYAVERQRDTYFRVPRGRLKLRERWRFDDETAQAETSDSEPIASQLIWYERPDEARPRGSNYLLVEIGGGEQLRGLLAESLGTVTQVVKRRTVYLYDNVRIHLDDVADLGTFIEFEAIIDEACDDAAARRKLDGLLQVFAIRPQQVVSHSYGDLTAR